MPMSNANRSFTVVLASVDHVDEEMADHIYSVIDDALLSSSGGEVRLEFDREASSLLEAEASAVNDIRGLGYSIATISPTPEVEAHCVDVSATETTNTPLLAARPLGSTVFSLPAPLADDSTWDQVAAYA